MTEVIDFATRRSSNKRFVAALVCVQCPDVPESVVVNGFVD